MSGGRTTQHCHCQDENAHCKRLWCEAVTFSVCFFPQNGQTAQAVADGASHQDIVDLLKAHAESRVSEPSSSTDLLWARPTLFTSTPLRLADPRPFNSQEPVLSTIEGEKIKDVAPTNKTVWPVGKSGFALFTVELQWNLWDWSVQYVILPHLCQHALWVFMDMLHQPLSGQKTKGAVRLLITHCHSNKCDWQDTI